MDKKLLKRTLDIEETPERLKSLLIQIKKDVHLSETFEGTINAGRINGFYTNLALINGMVIGDVKISGEYDLSAGKAQFRVKPSNLFWLVQLFCLLGFSLLAYKVNALAAMFFVFFSLVKTLIYLLESRSFINEVKRIEKNL